MNKQYALVWNVSQGCWNVASEKTHRRGKSSGKVVAATLLAVCGSALFNPAQALPLGANVVSGNADIMNVGQTGMSINQHTDRLITQWDSFNVDAGERVTFNQPTSHSIALNRVVGSNGSEIQGRIDANGQVFLVNPNGVLFGRNAQVNVGGLVASTQDIADADFTSGRYRFSGNALTKVTNLGTLTAADGGSVALLGAQVDNRGVIRAQLGSVALAAGNDLTLNFDQNRLLSVQVDGGVTNALASNGGLLQADGGQVLMTARAASTVLQSVVNNQGTLEAKTLNGRAGKIVLDGNAFGKVSAGGAMTANALNAPGAGGTVDLKGAKVEVALGTVVDTRASNGLNGQLNITSDSIAVGSSTVTPGVTIHSDTLSRNLATTNVELTSKAGDINLNGATTWASSNSLKLDAKGDIRLDGPITASGANATLKLKADKGIQINQNVALSGDNALLQVDSVEGHRLKPGASVKLSGAYTQFVADGQYYNVVRDVSQLKNIGDNLNGLYVLGADIKGSGTRWTVLQAIGGSNGEFTGTFDGLGNTIQDMSFTGNRNIGLFATSSGTLRNLNLNRINVYASGSSGSEITMGSLVGNNKGTIADVTASNITVGASPTYPDPAGGLVGRNSGEISRAHVLSGQVTGSSTTSSIGGLVGENVSNGSQASITDSSANVTVSSNGVRRNSLGGVGGLVGLNRRGVISNSTAAGTVTTDQAGLNVGGLVGYNLSGNISGSSTSNTIYTRGSGYVGGLVGYNSNGSITSSTSSASLQGSGEAAIGGLVGRNSNNSELSNVETLSSASVQDSSGAYVGGLVGLNESIVGSASSAARVSGGANSNVGGLIGGNIEGTVSNAVASGSVSGGASSFVGGLVGVNTGEVSGTQGSGSVTVGNSGKAGGLVGSNAGYILTSSSNGSVNGGTSSIVGGLVGENQDLGVVRSSSSDASLSSGSNSSMGGLVGANLGSLEYSTFTGSIQRLSWGQQVYGSLVGTNYGNVKGNTVTGPSQSLPFIGANYTNQW
ncbi:MAG: Heme/hemopexin-binding protein [Pseudomonas sp.]|nr:MAG: Heme/hemopexin-binding protein [Pseudomonas sp.]